MKEIDLYINSVYENMDHSPEVEELKGEMRQHLIEAVEELRREGKSEQESIYIAISRFGLPIFCFAPL
jgi:hypothetical protein